MASLMADVVDPELLQRLVAEATAKVLERMGPQQAKVAPRAERTVGELHADWLQTLGPVARKNRVSQGRHLKRPFRHQGVEMVLADLRPSQCLPAVLASWQLMLESTPSELHKGRMLSAGTVHQIRMGIQSMWKHYVETEEIHSNPWRKVKKVKGRDRQRMGFTTRDDVERYADAMTSIGAWVARHMFATGNRVMNQLRLQKHEIDWESEDLVITVKGGKTIRIPVATQTLEEMRHLCALHPKSPWVYPNPRDPMKPISYATFTGWSRRARKKTGLAPGGEPMVPHMLRHGTAVDMIDHGADITEVQAQLAHSDIKLSSRYAKMRGKAMDRLRARQNARFSKP